MIRRGLTLVCGSLLLSACLPVAWDGGVEPASTFVGTVGVVTRREAGRGGGMGGMGGSGGMGMGGGPGGGGGGMPGFAGGAGGGPRPIDPIAIGFFSGGTWPGGVFDRSPLRSTTLSTVPRTRDLVAVVDDADALFVLGVPNRRLPLPAGSRPSSVAISPNGLSAWVALRGLGSVARVTLATGEFVTVAVGAEPTGIALSPSGRTAVVTTFGERSVSLVDTGTLSFSTVAVGGNPRAVAITDNADFFDADESAWVTLFYGELLAEGTDTGRRGVVVEISLATKTVINRVTLGPLPTGSGVCVPNQLNAIALQAGRAYVTHVCASPAAPQGPSDSIYAGLSVINLLTRTEDTTPPLGSRLLRAMVPIPSQMANPVDVAPLPGRDVVVLSQGANAVQMGNDPFSIRAGLSPFYMPGGGPQRDDPAAGVPTGLVVVNPELVFVLDASGRRVMELNLMAIMSPGFEWPFESLPPEGSPAYVERLGRRHFATAEGLWSADNSMSCTSCHPDGLTDGLTWVFPAGPRQTPSLAGTFERGRSSAHRAQGWTATADEISDVEGIVRSLAGGTGAITNGIDGGPLIPLGTGFIGPGGLARHDGLSASSRDLLARSRRDWLDVEAWISTLPRPPASQRLDLLTVSRGRQLFANAGCSACHGGAQWTVSRVPYVPSLEKNGSAVGDDGFPAMATGLRTEPRNGATLWNPQLNRDTLKVSAERVSIDGGLNTIGPERITCVLRDVGTFNRSDPLEVKANGQPAQGELGFNPPSLIGVATSAPYLHHGKAKTLTELFSPQFAAHHEAGVPGFLETADGGVDASQVAALVAFLESIDELTVPFPIPMGADVCGSY